MGTILFAYLLIIFIQKKKQLYVSDNSKGKKLITLFFSKMVLSNCVLGVRQ